MASYLPTSTAAGPATILIAGRAVKPAIVTVFVFLAPHPWAPCRGVCAPAPRTIITALLPAITPRAAPRFIVPAGPFAQLGSSVMQVFASQRMLLAKAHLVGLCARTRRHSVRIQYSEITAYCGCFGFAGYLSLDNRGSARDCASACGCFGG